MAVPGLSQGLARERRVRKRWEFLAAQKAGKRVSSAQFVLYASSRRDGDLSRLGVTVSKKVGGAVVRNRIKRWVKEIFRSFASELRDSTDFIVIAKPGSTFHEFHQVRGELAYLLKRVGR